MNFHFEWTDHGTYAFANLMNSMLVRLCINDLATSRKFPGYAAEIKIYTKHDTIVLCKKRCFKDREEAMLLAEKLAGDAIGLTRPWLAQEVYEKLAEHARHDFGEVGIATMGMYLLGSILRGTSVDLRPRQTLTKVLKKLFPPKHDVWRYVTISL